jgi:hypothetical protein
MSNIKYKLNTTKISNSSIKSEAAIRSWDVWEYNLLSLLVIAIIGNSLSILAMKSKKLRSSNTTLFLISLAMSDMCVLIIKFLVNMQKLYRIHVFEFCIVIKILPDIISFTSCWLIITTTIERCIAVSRPFDVSILLSKTKCFLIIFMILILSSLVSTTQIVCLKSLPKTPYFCGIKGDFDGPCRYYINSIYPGIRSALISWIPSILAIFLNIFIIKALSRARIQRKEMANLLPRNTNFVMKDVSMPTGSSITKVLGSSKETSAKYSIRINRASMKNQHSNLSQERQITIMLCTISLTFVVIKYLFNNCFLF